MDEAKTTTCSRCGLPVDTSTNLFKSLGGHSPDQCIAALKEQNADYLQNAKVEEGERATAQRMVELEIESRKHSAAKDALDTIAEVCGCPGWDYPLQLVRDVKALAKEKDELLTSLEEEVARTTSLEEELEQLKAAADTDATEIRRIEAQYKDDVVRHHGELKAAWDSEKKAHREVHRLQEGLFILSFHPWTEAAPGLKAFVLSHLESGRVQLDPEQNIALRKHLGLEGEHVDETGSADGARGDRQTAP
jgi:hypothetical protein